MKKESAERAAKIIEELKEISDYKKLLENDDYKNVAHMAMLQHFGNNESYNTVHFDPYYNKIFIPVIKEIIKNLEQELSDLK